MINKLDLDIVLIAKIMNPNGGIMNISKNISVT